MFFEIDGFHTIKSILNKNITLEYYTDMIRFHTIKSILNNF